MGGPGGDADNSRRVGDRLTKNSDGRAEDPRSRRAQDVRNPTPTNNRAIPQHNSPGDDRLWEPQHLFATTFPKPADWDWGVIIRR